jgi:hypothetical protein
MAKKRFDGWAFRLRKGGYYCEEWWSRVPLIMRLKPSQHWNGMDRADTDEPGKWVRVKLVEVHLDR